MKIPEHPELLEWSRFYDYYFIHPLTLRTQTLAHMRGNVRRNNVLPIDLNLVVNSFLLSKSKRNLMASPLQRLGYLTLRLSHRTVFRRKHYSQPSLHRTFLTTSSPLAADDSAKDFDPQSLDPSSRAEYNLLTPSERKEWITEKSTLDTAFPSQTSTLLALASQAANETDVSFPEEFVPPTRKSDLGLMAMGEEDEEDSGPDEVYEGDDISSLAHADLELHREVREYMRVAGWEMPLLTKLVVPFVLPKLNEVCRWRMTTYCGETHPAEKKVVVEFATRDLVAKEAAGLTEAQRIKLIKLAGPRYDPRTDIVKMSCEIHETQVANKKHLSDLVDTLIEEAKDPNDMFEDVPVDFRHVKLKPKYEFPEGWKLNGEEKKQRLEAERERAMIEQGRKEEVGQVVDGREILKKLFRRRPAHQAREPVMVPAEKASGSRGKSMARSF